MLSLPVSVRIFVCTEATDMRRSFDRLAQMVEEHLGQDPESGHLYLFFNRRRDCVKMLLWEGGRVRDLVQEARNRMPPFQSLYRIYRRPP